MIGKICYRIACLLDDIDDIKIPKFVAVTARIISLVSVLMLIPYFFLAAFFQFF